MMRLGIYSLKKILFQGKADSVNCMTESGEITILQNHKPLISVLRSGVIKIVDENKKDHYIPANSGFLEVRMNDAKFIIEEVG